MIKVKKLTVGLMKTNCYILYDDKNNDCAIIDPGDDAEFITQTITENDFNPKFIIATHGHFDHVMAVSTLKLTFNIPFYMRREDDFLLKNIQSSALYYLRIKTDPYVLPDYDLDEKRIIRFSDDYLKIIYTPGHTPGSISIYSVRNNFAIIGDIFFKYGFIGRYDTKYSDKFILAESIKKILNLDEKIIIYPGHGEKTYIYKEKELLNKFIKSIKKAPVLSRKLN